MSIETISYSTTGRGWNTFHSWIPDWSIGLNSSLYSWKNGNLYKHHSNSIRNNFYGTQYDSTITPIFNDDRTNNKVFNTISVQGNFPWKAEVTTNMDAGVVEASYYKEKEDFFYAFIRRNPGTVDLKALSTQGVGDLTSYAAPVLTFSFDIAAPIAIGDTAHVLVPSTEVLTSIGVIASFTSTTITITTPAIVPVPGDLIVITKDSTAESTPPRGYYMETKLTNSLTENVELFMVSSEVDESSP